jgi:hypothetical protein
MSPEGLEQSWVNALEQFTGRDQVLYQTGRAEIVGDELDLIMEDTVVVSDLFDLDAIFAECKAAGKFTEYETLDELFEANKTEVESEVVCDIGYCQWFTDIFKETTGVDWHAFGQYTLRLKGLHTPVTVNMNGLDVLSVTAFDQAVELGAAGMASDYFDGYSPVDYIRSTEDAVVIRINGGEMWDDFILITKEDYFRYPNEHDGHIALWVNEDGTLGYRQSYLFMDDIEEMGSHVLYQLTSRDQVLHNEGHAEIINGEVVFTAEKTVVFSDHFDADAMFSESKAAGEFTEYETLDELFEANKARE